MMPNVTFPRIAAEHAIVSASVAIFINKQETRQKESDSGQDVTACSHGL